MAFIKDKTEEWDMRPRSGGVYHCLTHGMTYSECCPVCGETFGGKGRIDPVEKQWLHQRPVLSAFADAMEDKLRKNDHKTSWRDLPIEAIKKLLDIERQELEVAMEFLSVEEAMGECVDLANFALILHDRLSVNKK